MTSAIDTLSPVLGLIRQYPIPFFLLLVLLNLLWNKFQPGLVSIPGPTAAAYTKLWRVYSVWRGHAHVDAIELHKKHGNLVRIAPNHVSVADPKWIPVFYSTKEDYTKVSSLCNRLEKWLTFVRLDSIQYSASRGKRFRK